MIVVYETHALGKTHVPFNVGLLQIAAFAYPDKAIRFYASPSHLSEVRSFSDPALLSRIEMREIDIPDRKSTFASYLRQTYKSFRTIEAETPQNALLLLSFIIPASLLAAKIYMRMSRHFCGAQAVLHGQLAEIAGWRSRNPLRRMKDFTSCLAILNTPRLRYIILEPSIAAELSQRMPGIEAYADILPHPVPADQTTDIATKTTLKLPVVIAYLGLVLKQKGFFIFRDVAEVTKALVGNKVRFLAIGHTQGKPLPANIDCLDLKPQTSYLSREDFTTALAECHFICLPFHGAHYLFSPSGTLLDAIAWKKPLIALDVPMVKSLFDQYGDIGYLCASPQQLCDTIEQIAEYPDNQRYQAQRQAMEKLYQARQPQALAKIYATFTDASFKPASFKAASFKPD